MKIAVPATGPDLDAGVARRFGQCRVLLVVDTETLEFEALPGVSDGTGAGAGISMVTLALESGAEGVVADFLPPHVARTLRENGLAVVSGVQGTVREAVAKHGQAQRAEGQAAGRPSARWAGALVRSLRQFAGILPILLGVVLLVGLFKTLVSAQAIHAVFTGTVLDTLVGAGAGSILAGHPVNSYVIGESLLDAGVGLSGVAAFLLTWVSVGLVQLPAESSALGPRFALVRNGAAFLLAMPVALLTAFLVECLR